MGVTMVVVPAVDGPRVVMTVVMASVLMIIMTMASASTMAVGIVSVIIMIMIVFNSMRRCKLAIE